MSDVEPIDRAEPGPVPRSPTPPSGGGAAGMRVPESGARVCEVSLEEFEGPLDLLLHLVRRHELDILDIPIAFVCERYLEYIDFMQAMDLEVAGDYLVMAATLAYLKSRELVPQLETSAEGEVGEDGEPGGDPRQQLIMRLLEYQKYKEAADRLDARPIAGRDTFGRGGVVELPPVDAGLAPITLFRLAEAYQRVLDRARIHKSHEVVMETVSVAARMEQLTSLLIERGRFDFEALFLERAWSSEAELRSVLVVTLMSILELVRMGVASVHQPIGADTILVERVASAEAAREALRGYDESLSFGDGPRPAAAEAPAEGEGLDDDEAAGEDDALAWEALLGGGAVGSDEDDDGSHDDAELARADDGSHDDAELARADDGSHDDAELARADDGSHDDAELARADDGSHDDAELARADDGSHDDAELARAGPAHDDAVEADAGAWPDAGVEQAARGTEPGGRAEGEPEAPSVAPGGPDTDDAGALARSVVSESPPSPGVDPDAAGEPASAPPAEDGALDPTDGDGQEHGENGEAEAVEGS